MEVIQSCTTPPLTITNSNNNRDTPRQHPLKSSSTLLEAHPRCTEGAVDGRQGSVMKHTTVATTKSCSSTGRCTIKITPWDPSKHTGLEWSQVGVLHLPPLTLLGSNHEREHTTRQCTTSTNNKIQPRVLPSASTC